MEAVKDLVISIVGSQPESVSQFREMKLSLMFMLPEGVEVKVQILTNAITVEKYGIFTGQSVKWESPLPNNESNRMYIVRSVVQGVLNARL